MGPHIKTGRGLAQSQSQFIIPRGWTLLAIWSILIYSLYLTSLDIVETIALDNSSLDFLLPISRFEFPTLQSASLFANAQNLRSSDRKDRKKRKKGGAQGDFSDGRLMKALQINFPLSSVDGSTEDWRRSAVFNEKLAASSTNDASWKEFSHAQDQEDIWLYENWFYGMENGVIMESGALNGIIFSTSFMFERIANWTALHVEADPENYGNLIVNRQQAINVHGALCSEPRILHYSSVGVLPVRGFVEFMSPSFMKKWHGKIYNNKTRVEDLPTVQCLTVKALTRQLNVKHIDIWILDVEGAEESVLKGTDFASVRINAIAMECDEHDISKNARKTDIIEANGFKCQLVERNCMCKNKNYQPPPAAPTKSLLKKFDGVKMSSKNAYKADAVV